MAGQIALSRDDQAAGSPDVGQQLQASMPGNSRSEEWTWVLVRAVPHDEGLLRFDSLFEVTVYPCELLWGPGTAAEATGWFEREQPQADEAAVLDRLFLIQYRGDHLYLPRRPEIALSLEAADLAGTWYVVRADAPTDAFGHVRNLLAGGSACSATGPCEQCAVTTVGTGNWDAVMALLPAQHTAAEPRPMPDVRVSSAMRWPRASQILGNGNWALVDQ